MTTSNETTERDLYEAWARKKGHDVVSRLETGGKFYVSSFTRHAWDIWQAARASLPPPSAEPVENDGQYLTAEQLANLRARIIAETVEKFAAASPPIQVAPSEVPDTFTVTKTIDRPVECDHLGFGKCCADECAHNAEYRAAPVPPVAPEQAKAQGCALCGCVGIHACPGHPMEPWSPEKVAELNAVLAEYESEPVAPEQNFCARCGKRNIGIHTCTPPGEEVAQERAYTDSYTVSQFANSENSRIAPEQASVPFELVDITSHKGWANFIYTGADCEGLCIAMVPPFVASAIRALISKEAAPEDVQLGKFSDMPAVNARPAPDVIQCFAAPCADSDVDQTRQLWQEAISQAAFYVLNHCQDGGHHAEAIMSMPLPAMQPTTGKEPT